MKAPTEPYEHTGADCVAWAEVNWNGGPRLGPIRYTLSLMQDRRDAALMLGAQSRPGSVAHWRPGLDHMIVLRGAQPGEELEWLVLE